MHTTTGDIPVFNVYVEYVALLIRVVWPITSLGGGLFTAVGRRRISIRRLEVRCTGFNPVPGPSVDTGFAIVGRSCSEVSALCGGNDELGIIRSF